jgi:hypothetical protein
MNKKTLALLVLVLLSPCAFAQLEEIVVTGSRVDEGTSMPGTFLRKTGDFLLLQVSVVNDTREEKARKDEIYATLRTALAAARRDGAIELSVIEDGGLVIPLKVDSATVRLRPAGRPDTEATTISVKTRIPASNADGAALISKLKDFVTSLKVSGRTELDADGDVEISVVGPNNYRDEIVALAAADANKVSRSLGNDYKVLVQDIDRPVRFVRIGLLELALFVPYRYSVIPGSVTSVQLVPPRED